jgi:hypothetical protein
LFFAVIATTLAPCSENLARMLSALTNSGWSIIISCPVVGFRKKFPEIPCTEGGTPVMTETLFRLVKAGIAPSATGTNPSVMNLLKVG